MVVIVSVVEMKKIWNRLIGVLVRDGKENKSSLLM